jgi:D-alanine-D-alanine ligase
MSLQRSSTESFRGYAQPAFIEEFFPGRAFTVGVLDGSPPKVLPILEIKLGGESAYSYAVKIADICGEACPADLSAKETGTIGRLTIDAGCAIGCRDYWRVDFRLDARRGPSILEINALPGLQLGYSDMTKMAGPTGMSYPDIVRWIVGSATLRRGAG